MDTLAIYRKLYSELVCIRIHIWWDYGFAQMNREVPSTLF